MEKTVARLCQKKEVVTKKSGWKTIQFVIFTQSATSEAHIVNHQSIHPCFVGQISENNTTNGVGNTDDGQQVAGLFLVDVQHFGLGGQINVGHIETDAGAEIRYGEQNENGIVEQIKIHHFHECVPGGDRNAAATFFWRYL